MAKENEFNKTALLSKPFLVIKCLKIMLVHTITKAYIILPIIYGELHNILMKTACRIDHIWIKTYAFK